MRDRLRYMWHAAVPECKRRSPDTGGPISLSYEGWEFFCSLPDQDDQMVQNRY